MAYKYSPGGGALRVKGRAAVETSLSAVAITTSLENIGNCNISRPVFEKCFHLSSVNFTEVKKQVHFSCKT